MAKKVILFLLLILASAVVGRSVLAAVASSTNYQIETDSIGFLGATSSSASYQLNQTGGELATGTSSSATYNLHAGWQAMQSAGAISLSVSGAQISLSPSLAGLTTGTTREANSSAFAVAAIGDGVNYRLSVNGSGVAGGGLATEGEDTPVFVAYNSGPNTPTYNWSLASQSGAYFGFRADSVDLVTKYKNDSVGGVCGSGSGTSDHCWNGLPSLIDSENDETIAQGQGTTLDLLDTTDFYFRAAIGSLNPVTPETYVGGVRFTAIAI